MTGRGGFMMRARMKTIPAIAFAGPQERGVTQPWVMPAAEGYEMWYCTCGWFSAADPSLRNYDIGYAVSEGAKT